MVIYLFEIKLSLSLVHVLELHGASFKRLRNLVDFRISGRGNSHPLCKMIRLGLGSEPAMACFDSWPRKLVPGPAPQTLRVNSLCSCTGRTSTSNYRKRVLANAGERSLSENAVEGDVPPPGCSRFKVELKKPLGLVLEENGDNIFVAEVLPGGNAERTGLVEVGDQLIATSAVVYGDEEAYQGVKVRKGMQVIRLNVRGERFETVMAAIGTHPGYMSVALELQKCKPTSNNGGL